MSDRTLRYQPALDGVRALAVTTVLMFHHGVAWMSGGYVGVSVFFTLSGYLITSLLVAEHRERNTISLGRFYARRARRLLPAGLLCLALVVIARRAGEFELVPNLRRDLLGSLFQVQNWVKLLGPASYTELLNTTTGELGPLEHYWSLAIEEQFYWLWPLAVLGGFALVRSWRGRRFAVTALALAASAAAPAIAAAWGADAAYWATPARAGEILVGAAVAMWLRGDDGTPRPIPRWTRWLAAPAVAVVVAVSTVWPANGGPAYDGLLPVFALASAALIVGLQGPSPVRTLLSLPPVVWVGRISYGLYLYHWPVFVLLGDRRTGVEGPALFVLRTVVTLAIAIVSYAVVERPIRNARLRRPHPFALQGAVAAAAAAVLGLVALVTVPDASAEFYTPDTARAKEVALEPVESLVPLRRTVSAPAATRPRSPATTTLTTVTADTAVATIATPPTTTATATSAISPTMTTSPTTTTSPSTTMASTPAAAPVPDALPLPSRPVRILVIGDSTALATGTGLIEWAAQNPVHAQVTLATSSGCGFVRDTEIDEDLPFQAACDRLLDDELPVTIEALLPDVAVLMVTMRDLEDRTWSQEEGQLTPFDPRYRQRLAADQEEMVLRLHALGIARVVWIVPPLPVAPFQGERRVMADPARYAVQEDAIRAVAARVGDIVTVVDLDDWMAARGMIHDGVRRPDGVHFTPAASLEISESFLAPRILAAALGGEPSE